MIMKASVYILLISIFIGCSGNVQEKITSNESYKIIGYVAGYEDYDPALVDATKLTHINYAFANIVDGNVQFELDVDSTKIAKLIGLKKNQS